MWVADATKTTVHSGIQLVKRYFNICDDSGLSHSKKLSHSKDFRKTVSHIKDNPFLQVIEYISNETVYKPRCHDNSKDKTVGEYSRTAPSVIKEMNKSLTSGCSVSRTYTSLVRKCNDPKVQGIMNPRNLRTSSKCTETNYYKTTNK